MTATRAGNQTTGARCQSRRLATRALDDPPYPLGFGTFGTGTNNLKFTVTVKTTGTATPFRSVGVYTQPRTAVRAASSSNGTERSTSTSVICPPDPIVAWRYDEALQAYLRRL